MASTFNRFGALAVRHSFRIRPQSVVQYNAHASFFHQSALRLDEKSPKDSSQTSNTTPISQPDTATAAQPLKDEIVDYGELAEGSDPFWGFPNSMSAGEREKIKKEMEDFIQNPPEDQKEQVRQWRREVAALEQSMIRQFEAEDEPEPYVPQPRVKNGLLNMGVKDRDNPLEDPEDEGDDITSTAHGELEKHRELREYMRIAAWEMPLLSKYAREFQPPSKDTPLRFRHTTYLGETHPAQNKIVVEFCTADLELTHAQRLKLIKLAGVRYDPRKDLVKMSCEMFETPAQNKRYLGDLVDTLIMEAKNESAAEGGKDQFEDVAPDFRHVRMKKRIAFPNAWKITPHRQKALDSEREQRALAEQDRRDTNQLVSGSEIIDAAMKTQARLAQTTVERQRAGVRITR